jgi:hypothetical protein
MVDTDITAGRNGKLLVYLRSGRHLEFSNLLGDFARLADTSPGVGLKPERRS